MSEGKKEMENEKFEEGIENRTGKCVREDHSIKERLSSADQQKTTE